MKKTLSIILSIFLLLTSLEAGLTWESKEMEFQATFDQDEQEAIFHFTNDSDFAVKITKVKSSCGCTAAAPDKDFYLPGETGEVKVLFRFGNRQGRQSKKIYVSYEESIPEDSDSIVPSFKANAEKTPKDLRDTLSLVTHIPIRVAISTQYLGWKVGSEPVTREVTMVPADENPVELEFAAEPKGYEVEALPLEDSRGLKLLITPKDTSERSKNFLSVKAMKDNQIEHIYRVLLMIR